MGFMMVMLGTNWHQSEHNPMYTLALMLALSADSLYLAHTAYNVS